MLDLYTDYTGYNRRFIHERKPLVIRLLNRLVSSNLFVFIIAALAAIAFTYSMEFEFYVFVITYGLYVGLFADDLSPLMPLFIICYVTPSKSNNPGLTTDSVFYGKSGTFLLIYVLTVVTIIFIRIANDRNMGLRKLFLKKRALTFGMLLLGISYLLSGILWERYGEFAVRNLVFASLQFLSVFLLYFIFSATVDWSRFRVNYFVCIGIAVGLLVAYEVLWLYTKGDILVDGSVHRGLMLTGWGARNNIGAILVISIPFPFYFAAKKIFPAPWILVGVVLFVFSILSCSRTSMICAAGVFGLSYLILLAKARNKFGVYVTTVIGVIVVSALVVRYFNEIITIFKELPKIYETVDGEVVVNDASRMKHYRNGIKAFLEEPIFGKTFYPTDVYIYDIATLDSFSSFFPPRWHNTIIQMLASCGAVGITAYVMHRISTVVVFVKRKNDVNVVIGISILSLLLMSLLDCHFFNIGPTLFYSMALAVMEFGNEPD